MSKIWQRLVVVGGFALASMSLPSCTEGYSAETCLKYREAVKAYRQAIDMPESSRYKDLAIDQLAQVEQQLISDLGITSAESTRRFRAIKSMLSDLDTP